VWGGFHGRWVDFRVLVVRRGGPPAAGGGAGAPHDVERVGRGCAQGMRPKRFLMNAVTRLRNEGFVTTL
jgi:hypothetical protein